MLRLKEKDNLLSTAHKKGGEGKMYNPIKTLKKGMKGLVSTAVAVTLPIILKNIVDIAGLDTGMSIGQLTDNILQQTGFIAGTATLGSLITMFTNWLKNRKKK